ncbi:MAG: methyltransferase domain-containing protein [Adlercreutzia sp.]|nr:methyltransferase domain-containing protein [Adlercreutzia sp.]
MHDEFTPLLTSMDWNEEWKELQKVRRHADDAAFWDKRSATFTTKDAPNLYVEKFLEYAGIRPGETVFDMGCGTGALAVPLGEAGHKVVAADFSQGMLDQMQSRLDEAGVRTVFPKLMSWEDDWPAFGVREGMTDVAVASRSIATADLRDALLRLTEVARRRVCITLATGSSPRVDERILAAVGLPAVLGRDYLYAFNILAAEGVRAEVRYIDSTRDDTFASPEDAYEKLAAMIDDSSAVRASDTERQRARANLREWLTANLVPNESAGAPDRKGIPQLAWRLAEPRTVTWAFLAWNAR